MKHQMSSHREGAEVLFFELQQAVSGLVAKVRLAVAISPLLEEAFRIMPRTLTLPAGLVSFFPAHPSCMAVHFHWHSSGKDKQRYQACQIVDILSSKSPQHPSLKLSKRSGPTPLVIRCMQTYHLPLGNMRVSPAGGGKCLIHFACA